MGGPKVSQRQQSFGGRVGGQTEKRRVTHFFKLRFFERIKKLFQTISEKGRISKKNRKIFKRDTINYNWKMDDLKMELFEEVKLNILKFIWRTYFYSQKFAFALSFVFAVFCINFSNIFALIFSMKIRRRNKSNPTLLGLYFSRILVEIFCNVWIAIRIIWVIIWATESYNWDKKFFFIWTNLIIICYPLYLHSFPDVSLEITGSISNSPVKSNGEINDFAWMDSRGLWTHYRIYRDRNDSVGLIYENSRTATFHDITRVHKQ